jgi:NAD(P)-dependent dehydrogenase (short-subunit alcohol dehydrogenase family)
LPRIVRLPRRHESGTLSPEARSGEPRSRHIRQGADNFRESDGSVDAMAFTRYDSLKGRTVVVTGGASGIGAAFVRAFAANGASVAFLDIDSDLGTSLAKALAGDAKAPVPLFVPCDLTDIASLRAALDTVRATLGPAAVLVNNAANDQRYEFAAMTPEAFDRTIAVNFRHVFFAAQAVAEQMREVGHGSIINMSSVSWMRGIPGLEAYASTKAAIVGLTNTLARALGPSRIRVNAIAPGMVLTERQRRLWFQDESQIEVGRALQCLPDLIAPEDIANLALFLAADDSRLITKQCISVNGGTL